MKIVYFREVGKMLTKKKKVFIILGMVALLVVTGCLNLFLSKNNEKNIQAANYESASFLSSYRLTKKETRETMLSYYQSIIASSTDQEQIAETNALIGELTGRMEEEMVLEHMIMAAGYEDCVVTNTDGSYTVMVKSNGLNTDDITKILAILNGEGILATNVKVTSV